MKNTKEYLSYTMGELVTLVKDAHAQGLSLLIIGYPGSGKSTLSKQAGLVDADRFVTKSMDTDEFIYDRQQISLLIDKGVSLIGTCDDIVWLAVRCRLKNYAIILITWSDLEYYKRVYEARQKTSSVRPGLDPSFWSDFSKKSDPATYLTNMMHYADAIVMIEPEIKYLKSYDAFGKYNKKQS